jgi:hypothetical protein
MQNAGDVALAAAVDANERELVYKVEIDWNKNGLYTHALSDITDVVSSLSVQRDVNSSLPDEATLVEGFFTEQMTVRVGGTRPGDTSSIVDILAMWRTDSTLFGQPRTGVPIRAFIGHRVADGTITMPQQFQGYISSCKVDSSAREATLTCSGRPDAVRTVIDLPAFAMPPVTASFDGTELALKSNSQWAIDHILRQNGYYMSPPLHTKTFFAATLHGSPTVNWGHRSYFVTGEGTLQESSDPYLPGRPGWGLAWGGGSGWWAGIEAKGNFTNFGAKASQGICMQMQVNTDYAGSVFSGQNGALCAWWSNITYGSGTGFILRINPNRQLILDCNNGGSLTNTIIGPILGTGWQDVWCEIDIGATFATSTVRFPGVTASVDLSGLSTSPTNQVYTNCTIFAQLPMHDVQFTDRTGLATGATRYDPATWVPQADIDTGLNAVWGIPLRRGAASWDLLKEIVGAEFGVLGFTEAGRPFFKNRNTIRKASLTTVKTLDQSKVLTSFGMEEQSASVRNIISSTLKQRTIGAYSVASTRGYSNIYTLRDATAIMIPPGQTTLFITIDEPAALMSIGSPVQVSTTTWNDPAQPPVRHAFVTQTTGGVEVTTGVTIDSITPWAWQTTGIQDQARLIITNTSANFYRFETSDLQPALQLSGLPFFDAQPVSFQVSRSTSRALYGDRTLEIPANDWHQIGYSLQVVSLSLLKDLASPVPVVDDISAVGDCRLQLLDSVQIEDKGGLGGPMLCVVTGINRQLDASGGGAKLVDQLTVRAVAAPGKWILGHSIWSVLGQTTKL